MAVIRPTPAALDGLSRPASQRSRRTLAERWRPCARIEVDRSWWLARPGRCSGVATSAATPTMDRCYRRARPVHARDGNHDASGAYASRHTVYRTSILLPEGLLFPGAGQLGGIGRFALSPNGRRVVFVASDPEGNVRLWVRSLDSSPRCRCQVPMAPDRHSGHLIRPWSGLSPRGS